MADLLQRAHGRPGVRTDDRPPRPLVLSACAVSGAIASAGLIVAFGLAMIAWLAGSAGSTADALRAGALGWLVGHGSGLTVSGAAVTAVPLGLVLGLAVAFFALARRFAAASSVTGPREVLIFAGTGGLSYAAVLAAGAWLSASDEIAAGPLRSAVAGFVLAAGFGGLGAAQQAGLLRAWSDAAPSRLRAGARGAAYANALLLGAGLVLTTLMLLADTETLDRLWSGLDTGGVVGGIGLALLCLALAPNLVLWSVAVLLGPGVAVGTGTSVTLTGVSLGQLPAFPLLAALPARGQQPGWVIAFAAVPVLAGIVAGYVAHAGAPGERWMDAAGIGAGSGVAAAPVCGLLVALSAGSIGPGRMAEVGPDGWLCVGAALLALGAGGAAGALLGHYRVARAHDPAE